MKAYLLIGLGSAIGGVARHWLTTFVAVRMAGVFPWGTFFVNVSGSFLIGFIASLPDARFPGPGGIAARQFLTIGVMGGFTTFSAFSLQTVTLLQANKPAIAALYAALSVLACVAGAWGGSLLAHPK
jgi:fluoride exporter